jgi:hypothetical protein
MLERLNADTEELQQIHRHYPSDLDISRSLAGSLVELFGAFIQAGRPSQLKSTTDELRRLYRQLHEEPTVRQQLARVLTCMAILAKEDRSRVTERAVQLNEIRSLYEQGRDPVIRELLGQA